jgi:hypothetical protein
MSFLGPIRTAFQRWCVEFQLSKLSWCTAWAQKYLHPALTYNCIRPSESKFSAFQSWTTSFQPCLEGWP